MTLDDIICYVGEQIKITVDITPDGYGDAVRTVAGDGTSSIPDHSNNELHSNATKKMFVKPHEQEMALGEFRSVLRNEQSDNNQKRHDNKLTSDSKSRGNFDDNELSIYPMMKARMSSSEESLLCTNAGPPVVYYSRQNDCLRTEMTKLFSTGIIPKTFSFAEEAFGTGPPDAINLWIGNEKSVSSIHKDHYENLFYVCSGQKEFILNPPADILFLQEKEFQNGTFRPICNGSDLNNASWVVEPDDELDEIKEVEDNNPKTKWIEPDVKMYLDGKYSSEQFPLLSKSNPVKVLVSQGEMLYIPSLWLHRVTQTTETVGVNFWYDMKFDSAHWCYFNFIQQMKSEQQRS